MDPLKMISYWTWWCEISSSLEGMYVRHKSKGYMSMGVITPICVHWKWGYSIAMLVYQRVFEKAWPLVDQELTLKRCGFILWSPPWWGMWGLTVAAVWVDMLTLLFSGWHGHSDTDDFQDSTFSIELGPWLVYLKKIVHCKTSCLYDFDCFYVMHFFWCNIRNHWRYSAK